MDFTKSGKAKDPGPGPIMAILAGQWQTTILLTAMESDLFTELADGPATLAEISERVRYRMPGARNFLLALVSMGLLQSQDGKFSNSTTADRYLVRGRPEYLGGYMKHREQELRPAWDRLGEALRTGKPQNPAAVVGSPYDSLFREAESMDAFLDGMDVIHTSVGLLLSELDWSPYTTLLDVGGSRGHITRMLVSKNPHLEATVFDLPVLEPAFNRYMANFLEEKPISFHGGDFFTDPLPESDVLILGHVLHNWGEKQRIALLHNAYQAVRPGGAVYVYDPMVGDDQPSLHSVLVGLTMLVWSAGGHEYSIEECHHWLIEAGFRPETVELGTDAAPAADVLVIGHKDQ